MAYLGNAPARSFISFERQVFTIVNSQTAYTLDHSVNNENDLRLVINNIVQEPGSGKAYTASGTTLTLSAALTNGTDEMYCVFLGRATATNAPSAGSVGTSQLASDAVTEAKIADDAVESEHLNDNVISGQTELAAEPADTDEFLVSDAGTLKRIDYSLIKGGGITEADSFRLSATQAISSGTDTVLSGFARDNESTFGKIGTGLSESSGVFTFATTGIYLIIANFYLRINGDLTYGSPKIQGTTNNSGYVNMSYNDQSIKQVVGNTYAAVTNHAIMDCQDTSNYKFRLSIYGTHTLDVIGSSNDSHTYVTTIRLGDT
jgi:hypothetical protein